MADPAPYIVYIFGDADETHKELLGDLLLFFAERSVHLIGPLGQGAAHPTETLVVGDRNPSVHGLGHQGGQGVLHQGEASRLFLNVGKQLIRQALLEDHTGVRRGLFDGVSQLCGFWYRQGQEGLTDDRAEQLVAEWVVEEVGPKGQYDPYPASRIGGGVHQVLDEGAADLVAGDDGVQLLELVDDDDQLSFEVSHQGFADPQQAPLTGCQLGCHVPHRLGGEFVERRSQLIEGMRPGHGGDRHPPVRTGECSVDQRRQQPGTNKRRLPGARWADHGDHAVVADQLDEAADFLVAAKEVSGVVDVEWA